MNALYSLYDALVSINVPADKARAVVDAMERDMTTLLATKADLSAHQLLTKKDIEAGHALLKRDIDANYCLLKQDIDSNYGSLKHDSESKYALLKHDSESKYALLKQDIEASRDYTIVRLGYLVVAVAGLLFGALKLS